MRARRRSHLRVALLVILGACSDTSRTAQEAAVQVSGLPVPEDAKILRFVDQASGVDGKTAAPQSFGPAARELRPGESGWFLASEITGLPNPFGTMVTVQRLRAPHRAFVTAVWEAGPTGRSQASIAMALAHEMFGELPSPL